VEAELSLLRHVLLTSASELLYIKDALFTTYITFLPSFLVDWGSSQVAAAKPIVHGIISSITKNEAEAEEDEMAQEIEAAPKIDQKNKFNAYNLNFRQNRKQIESIKEKEEISEG
jgi:hypothetical protein